MRPNVVREPPKQAERYEATNGANGANGGELQSRPVIVLTRLRDVPDERQIPRLRARARIAGLSVPVMPRRST